MTQPLIQKINAQIPVHSLWDGFWIRDFDKGTLTLSASFDRTSYRNFDIVFEEVEFFNLPESFLDTDIYGDDLLHMASMDEIRAIDPGFTFNAWHVFAIELTYHRHPSGERNTYRFHIAAEHAYVQKCEGTHCTPDSYYTDPLKDQPFPCFANRVPLLK
ncbi:MAG: hypothetical protein R3D00_07075 [Bacteroidia bacterium]